MDEESRNKKFMRQINEELDREKGIIKGMSTDERWVLAIVSMVVAVAVLCLALLWSAVAHADSFAITLTCPADKTKNVCSLSRDEAEKVFRLIQHNNEVTVRLLELESSREQPQRCTPAGWVNKA